MARYLERVENTARLTQRLSASCCSTCPSASGLQWSHLIEITGSGAYYKPREKTSSERYILKFVGRSANPGSVLSCITSVRENVRTTRDLVPSEGWEHVNELYLYARKKFAKGTLPARLHEVLSEIVMRCQQIVGLLAGTMSHGDAYQFARIGRSLERADMTTRIIDVGSTTLIAPGEELPRFENQLWMAVLRSPISVPDVPTEGAPARPRPDVIAYLLQDRSFHARSPSACARSVRRSRCCRAAASPSRSSATCAACWRCAIWASSRLQGSISGSTMRS